MAEKDRVAANVHVGGTVAFFDGSRWWPATVVRVWTQPNRAPLLNLRVFMNTSAVSETSVERLPAGDLEPGTQGWAFLDEVPDGLEGWG